MLELVTIVDYGKVNPAINTNYFLNPQSLSYWTTSVNSDNIAVAWRVHFYGGGTGAIDTANTYYVRCVR